MTQDVRMTNIPTELLRTLVAVVDQRSFTKAAQQLGVTQPAVSAQIKRLQNIVGSDLFDRSAPGVALSDLGTRVVNYARRILAINDQIVNLSASSSAPDQVRLGILADYQSEAIYRVASEFRRNEPGLRLQIEIDHSANILRDMRLHQYDVVLAFSDTEQIAHARHSWSEPVVWAGATEEALEPTGLVSLFAIGNNSLSWRNSVAMLEQAKQPYELVLISRGLLDMMRAAMAGLGVFTFPLRTIAATKLAYCRQSSKLPLLPDILVGVYVRNDLGHAAIDRLADDLAAAVRPDNVAEQPILRRAAVA
jgi:DNA-binding transcriptional LysR family regulator